MFPVDVLVCPRCGGEWKVLASIRAGRGSIAPAPDSGGQRRRELHRDLQPATGQVGTLGGGPAVVGYLSVVSE